MAPNLHLILTCVNLGISVIGVVSLIFAILAYLKAVGLEKATHTVHFQPIDKALEGDEVWGMDDRQVNKINKINKEDYEGISL